jgi:hypothetical protein
MIACFIFKERGSTGKLDKLSTKTALAAYPLQPCDGCDTTAPIPDAKTHLEFRAESRGHSSPENAAPKPSSAFLSASPFCALFVVSSSLAFAQPPRDGRYAGQVTRLSFGQNG